MHSISKYSTECLTQAQLYEKVNPPLFTYLKLVVPAPAEITNAGKQMNSISYDNFFLQDHFKKSPSLRFSYYK